MFSVVSILPCVFLNEVVLVFLLKTVLSPYLHEGIPNLLVILHRLLLLSISSVRFSAWGYLPLEQIYRQSQFAINALVPSFELTGI